MELSFKTEKVSVLPEPKNNTLAFVDILVNDSIVIRGFRVCDGKKGRFVGFPSKEGKDKEGKEEWFPQVTFKNRDEEKLMSEVVLKSFEDKQKN